MTKILIVAYAILALQDIDYIDSVCVLYSTAPIAAQF